MGMRLGSWFTESGHPIVQNNTITNNEDGISLGSLGDQFSPIIQFNNILDNTN
jgi:parallel beta-helix repeat protein